jgi:hypothetical protein
MGRWKRSALRRLSLFYWLWLDGVVFCSLLHLIGIMNLNSNFAYQRIPMNNRIAVNRHAFACQ